MQLSGKVALVTGSTSGIGLGIARALARAGASVLLNGFGEKRLIDEHLAEFRTQHKVSAGYSAADMSKPQGTLIERIRAGGFGLGGVLTPTGVGTLVEKGKQRIDLDGKPYLLETPLRANFALVQAFLADYLGNLYYALTARNFNPGVVPRHLRDHVAQDGSCRGGDRRVLPHRTLFTITHWGVT